MPLGRSRVLTIVLTAALGATLGLVGNFARIAVWRHRDAVAWRSMQWAVGRMSIVRKAIKAYQSEHGHVPYSALGEQAALRLLIDEGYLDLSYEDDLTNLAYLNPENLRIPEKVPRVLLREKVSRLSEGSIWFVDTRGTINRWEAPANGLRLGEPTTRPSEAPSD